VVFDAIICRLVREPPLLPLTDNAEIQTELHPIDKNIDRSYFWNIWDLKRRAIQLANLSHCKTVSSQTLKSFFRNNLRTQTYDKKEQISQTKRDNYSNVPKPSMFIFGLRGRKDDKQFIVDLTRPVDE
jgi:lambda repressor-like predicted transcriptional regulator